MSEILVHQTIDFISENDCKLIIKLAGDKFQKANTLGEEVDGFRIAEYMWFDDWDQRFWPLKRAIARISSTPVENQEGLHIVRYDVGGQFKPHHDFFHANTDYFDREMRKGGQRIKTVLIYLNDNFEGGETEFPDINLIIKPQSGKLIMWDNVNELREVNFMTLHAGLPVTKGVKYIMSVWVRESRFINT